MSSDLDRYERTEFSAYPGYYIYRDPDSKEIVEWRPKDGSDRGGIPNNTGGGGSLWTWGLAVSAAVATGALAWANARGAERANRRLINEAYGRPIVSERLR